MILAVGDVQIVCVARDSRRTLEPCALRDGFRELHRPQSCARWECRIDDCRVLHWNSSQFGISAAPPGGTLIRLPLLTDGPAA